MEDIVTVTIRVNNEHGEFYGILYLPAKDFPSGYYRAEDFDWLDYWLVTGSDIKASKQR